MGILSRTDLFYRHFKDSADFVPVDPNEADAWLAANQATTITDGYFFREPVLNDAGVADSRNTRLEYQLPTATAQSLGIKPDMTLIIAGTKYRVGALPDFGGHTHIAITRAQRRPS